ncbi:MAG: YiiX/YebB-like N1pC/P60 family cysteine hydrolase [Chloroflexota bacterium]
MRTRFFVKAVAIVALLAVLLSSTAGLAFAKPNKPAPPPDSGLQPGDILFVSNPDDVWYSPNAIWTHNAIYVGNNMVVEATLDHGVAYANLDGWGAGLTKAVKRLAKPRASTVNAAVAYAEQHVGIPYDIFFDKDTESRQYCSELI